jgi:hypothetical protein
MLQTQKNADTGAGDSMRVTLGTLSVCLLVLLLGCGSAPAKSDPFVGTWRPTRASEQSQARFVVTKSGGDYEGFIVADIGITQGPIALRRHGNVLDYPPLPGGGKIVLTYHPGTGRLTQTDSTGLRIYFELVSRATAHPAPTHQNPSPDSGMPSPGT